MKAERRPADSSVTELAPGVYRAQLPIDFTGLGHVNMYVFEDERGLAVTDPGLPNDRSWNAIVDRLRQLGAGLERVHTIVVTHSHPDHFGGAGRLAEQSGADIVAHHEFRVFWLAETYPDVVEAVPLTDPHAVTGEEMVRQLGAQAEWTERSFPPTVDQQAAVGATPELRRRYGAPVPARRVGDGDALRLARRNWRVVATPGHTADHICLHSDDGLLVAGDHVLPEITPHIGGLQFQDAVREYLTSLDRVRDLSPTTLVLPAHGEPFTDLADRVATIKLHHRDRLERLLAIAEAIGLAPVDAYSRELFPERYWGLMAESETYAHLEHLRITGRMRRSRPGSELLFALDPARPESRAVS